jgi:hypothetical protein
MTKDIVQHHEVKSRAPGVPITPEVMQTICDHIAVGGSLDSACREPGMPTSRGVRLHVLRDAQAAAMLHEARRQQTTWLVDQLVEIADDPNTDPRRAKNAINVRTWLLERLLPTLYAGTTKLQVETASQEPSLLEHQTLLEAIQVLWGMNAAETLHAEVNRIRAGRPADLTSVTIMEAMRPELRQALQAAFGPDSQDRLSEALRRATGEVRAAKAIAA